MPRLFLGNFDFEHALGHSGGVTPARLQRLNAELASTWLPVAEDGDFLWTPEPVSEGFWNELSACGLPRLRPVTDCSECVGSVALVPWGWTEALLSTGLSRGWSCSAPDPLVVRRVNSRRWSAARELHSKTAPQGMCVCESVDDVAEAIGCLPPGTAGWVLKAEFGMSGRERHVGRERLSDAALGWLRARLKRHGMVFFEPWLERIDEVGIQWQIPRQGSPQLVGAAPMVAASGGQYRGSWFRTATTHDWWNVAVEHTLHAAEDAQREGYFGPFGVDAMLFRDSNGATHVRCLQDVNARWTMGRVALEWAQFFPQAKSGYWWHGPAADVPAETADAAVICTAPDTVGETPVQHASAIVIPA